MRINTLVCLTAFSCAAMLSAQTAPAKPPAVQGLWKCILEQSDFGPNPSPSQLSLDMRSEGAILKVRQDSDEGAQDFTFHTDGTATTNTLPDGTEMTSHLSWQDGVLVGEHLFGSTKFKDRISITPDGKRMTLDRDIQSDSGNAKMHIVLERFLPPATARPSMAGAWKMDAAKSDFGGPMPSKFEATITVDGHVISMLQSTDQGEFAVKIRDDGQETTNDLNGMTMKSKMWWEQDVLVGDHIYNANGADFTFKDRTSFSPDGKVMTINRTGQMPDGNEIKMHIVLVKQ